MTFDHRELWQQGVKLLIHLCNFAKVLKNMPQNDDVIYKEA